MTRSGGAKIGGLQQEGFTAEGSGHEIINQILGSKSNEGKVPYLKSRRADRKVAGFPRC